MTNNEYVHGYSNREALRLKDQAETLDDIIHNDTVFPNGSLVLEAGCWVGAQTKIIAPKNLDSNFISVDLSATSINEAEALIKSLDIKKNSKLIINQSKTENANCFLFSQFTNWYQSW